MKINSQTSQKFINPVRNYYPPIFIIIVSIILLLFAVLNLGFLISYNKLEKAQAKIAIITDDQEVYVDYEISNIPHKAKLNSYSSSWKVGDTIEIGYDRNDPSNVETSPLFFLVISAAGGLIALSASIISIIKKKKSKINTEEALENLIQGGTGTLDEEFNVVTEFDNCKEYNFFFSGKLNQGHSLVDASTYEVLYEAVLTKFSLLSECDYDFVNHIDKTVSHHKIGKTITTGANSYYSHSHFTFDGKNIWDELHSNGITIDNDIFREGLKLEYTIKYLDKPIAYVRARGTEIIPSVKQTHALTKLPAQGLFSVKTAEENIPMVFLVLVTFARTEQYVYS